MAVEADLKNVKVVLKLAKGSQTISGCSQDATNENLYALGEAVGSLTAERLETITKVEEHLLTNE